MPLSLSPPGIRGFSPLNRKVLVHLQQLFDPKTAEKTEDGPPGMAEQLDLAEFTLERITHAVNLLQDSSFIARMACDAIELNLSGNSFDFAGS